MLKVWCFFFLLFWAGYFCLCSEVRARLASCFNTFVKTHWDFVIKRDKDLLPFGLLVQGLMQTAWLHALRLHFCVFCTGNQPALIWSSCTLALWILLNRDEKIWNLQLHRCVPLLFLELPGPGFPAFTAAELVYEQDPDLLACLPQSSSKMMLAHHYHELSVWKNPTIHRWCGLGMVISNLMLPLKPCAAWSPSPLWQLKTRTGGTKDQNHGLGWEQFTGNGNEIRRQ